jgi:hypothetical protein
MSLPSRSVWWFSFSRIHIHVRTLTLSYMEGFKKKTWYKCNLHQCVVAKDHLLHMHYFRSKYELCDISLRFCFISTFIYNLLYYLFLVMENIHIQLSDCSSIPISCRNFKKGLTDLKCQNEKFFVENSSIAIKLIFRKNIWFDFYEIYCDTEWLWNTDWL